MLNYMSYISDYEAFAPKLHCLPRYLDGKICIIELQKVNYNWRQMEWLGWYFEYLVKESLKYVAKLPGDRYGNVSFDLKRNINWDIKAASSKSAIILNDKDSMDNSIIENSFHGEIIGFFDVEYDHDRSFQKWHTILKGGKSKYEIEREIRTNRSRIRKKAATLKEIVFLILGHDDTRKLTIMRQGRNSDGSMRKPKYLLKISEIEKFIHFKIKL